MAARTYVSKGLQLAQLILHAIYGTPPENKDSIDEFAIGSVCRAELCDCWYIPAFTYMVFAYSIGLLGSPLLGTLSNRHQKAPSTRCGTWN